jgi:NADH:ubiquinone oxidoreductase subunit K
MVAVVGLALAVQVRRRVGSVDISAISTLRG